MNLPPRALQALVDLKQALLAREPSQNGAAPDPLQQMLTEVLEAPAPLREEPERRTPERTMRHARRRAVKFQRMCQRRQRF